MRQVPDVMTARWYSGAYIGDAKPIARVTIHTPQIRLVRTPENLFASLPFGGAQGGGVRELPNVKSVSWERNVDQDVATCTIEFFNTAPLPVGATPVERELDQPGYYTYNRGTTDYSSRWKHKRNEWDGALMPDNVIRTFEGYGCDPDRTPDFDPNLVQTGEWMIDDVDYSAEGIIRVTCRDVGRILLDQISFPPVTPFKSGFKTKELPDGAYAYPVMFQGENTPPSKVRVELGAGRLSLTYRSTSNQPYVGNGAVYGHRPQHAFDDSDSTYWLSIGNARPDQGYSFEWIEGGVKSQRVRRVRFKSWKGGHTAYLCLYVEGKGWIGTGKVPYNPNHPASAPNGADTKFYRAQAVTGTGWTEFDLGAGVEKVTRVRITFGGLQHSGLGVYPYRAGMRRFEVYGGATHRTDTITYEDKNYDDYTDIVKLLCAWGGFYWPRDVRHMVGEADADEKYMASAELVRQRVAQIRKNRGLPPDPASDEIWVQRIYYQQTWTIEEARNVLDAEAEYLFGSGAERVQADGEVTVWRYRRDDRAPTIKVGRIWGDLQQSGTVGPAPIPASVFDKKPLMDGIAYVRDILGFIFHIDEFGGVVFRAPNIYGVGNLMRSLSERSGERTNAMVTIDERQTLIGMSAKLSSRNVRERTFVAGTTGNVGHVAAGWNPNPIGLRRVGGWTDQHFDDPAEARVMAEMIALRQLFSYRTDSVTIAGYPAIQIDDQVRIHERVTSEGFIHYVKGINSTLDMSTGEYTYQLDTHWLGERPFKRWAFDPAQLSRETQEYLKGLYGG